MYSFVMHYVRGEPTFRVYEEGNVDKVVKLPEKDLWDKKFWSKLKKATDKVAVPGNMLHKLTCPVCGSKRNTFLRMYKQKRFCGFCGAHLLVKEYYGGPRIFLIAER